MSTELSSSARKFPYQEEVESLINELSWAETRVTPDKTRKIRENHLDYGWKAVLYEKSEGLLRQTGGKILSLLDNTDYRRQTPDYKWELEAPNGETYRIKGLDIDPETFEEEINRFLED